MAQNISFDKSSQSTFTKAVKNIKALIKENELTIRDQSSSDVAKVKGKKAVLGKERRAADQQGSNPTWKDQGKGVVYLSHIPEGFYEEEMNSYFSQFGRVTRLNLVRSVKNGKPKGYAFIEFLYSEVAQVVAETMNNYLMCGKLLKAEYIPGDRTYRGMFRNLHIRPDNCPRRKSQEKWVQNINKKLTSEEEAGFVLRETKRLQKLKKQLEKSGVHLDCQVEDGSPALPHSVMSKTEGLPILQIDESDSEVEFTLHPNVIKVVKCKSSPASSLSPTEKKQKKEMEKSVSKKKVMRSRSSSISTFSRFIKKVKGKTRKDVPKGRLQSNEISPAKHKSLSSSTYSPSLKRQKVGAVQDVSKQDLQSNVNETVLCESVSAPRLLPRVRKVEIEAGNVSTRKARPTVTEVVKRRSSSTPLLSPRMKKKTAEGKNGVSSEKVMKRRFSSTSIPSPSLKSVRGKVKKDVSKIRLQPVINKVVNRRSLSTSLPLLSVKKAANVISERKMRQNVTKVVKHSSLLTSLLSPSARKVGADGGQHAFKRKEHSSATKVAKRRSLS